MRNLGSILAVTLLLLTGFEKLVECLEKKKIISSKDSKEAIAKGFTSLVYALAK